MNKMQTINCTDDFIKKNIHVGETVIYNHKYYTFEGISGYETDLKNITSMLREIPIECIKNSTDKYIGKKFIYNGYEVEVLQQNKNGSYSLQAYDKKGKKYGGRFAMLKQDMNNLKVINN